jgi:hypothetical protein
MDALMDALMLEAMFASWRSAVVKHEVGGNAFELWLRRLFVTRLQVLTEGALA